MYTISFTVLRGVRVVTAITAGHRGVPVDEPRGPQAEGHINIQEGAMKRAFAVALALVIAASGCGGGDDDQEPSGIANPASVHCEEQGGRVDIRSDESGNEVGICVFPDGREVDEWSYYRGEAEPTLPEG